MVFPLESKLTQYQSLYHQRRLVDVITRDSFKDSDFSCVLSSQNGFITTTKKSACKRKPPFLTADH